MRELATHPDVTFVLIFENKGEAVGVSNPHPHCQIYATNFTFKYIETELAAGRRHLADTGRGLFQDILAAEQEDGRRIVSRHGSALPFVPYFARYAYETYVAPRRSVATIAELDDDRASRSRDGAARRGHPLRQSVADAVPLRHGAASGAGARTTPPGSTSTSSSTRRCAARTC